MTIDPHAGLSDLATLAEQYMETQPTCLLCHDSPATTPFLYVPDASDGDHVRGCCFALCVFCWLQDDFQDRVNQALRVARAEEAARWN
jgi:hypothetical protein